jgi:hypothetical protein
VNIPSLSACLTMRDLWLLAMLHEHQVLTSHQIAALAFGSSRSANRRLSALYRLGVLDSFRPLLARGTAPEHYVLGRGGAAVLAARRGIEVAALGRPKEHLTRTAFSPVLAHTVGRNGLLVALAAEGRTPGAHQLALWLPERACTTLWGDFVRPDAFAQLADPGQAVVPFFLEFDTGTESLARVEAKLPGYAALAETTGTRTPVLIHTCGSRREAHLRTRLTRAAEQLALPVATCAADLHPNASCAGRLWLPAVPGPTDRHRLADLPRAFGPLSAPLPEPGADAYGQLALVDTVPPLPPDGEETP